MTGITKCEKDFDLYTQWLEYFGIEYKVLDYSSPASFEDFEKCNGIILTGGVDIYPELYNDWEEGKDAGKFNPERDGFEMKLLEKALSGNFPVLGICRGCQLINVYFKGSLIYDIPSIRRTNHNKISPTEQRIHPLKVFENTLLYDILHTVEGNVTSSHHQSVDRLGEGLMVNAKAPDGIIEGIEYADRNGRNFLLGIQWHPERFKDFNDVFSKNIILKFGELVK